MTKAMDTDSLDGEYRDETMDSEADSYSSCWTSSDTVSTSERSDDSDCNGDSASSPAVSNDDAEDDRLSDLSW